MKRVIFYTISITFLILFASSCNRNPVSGKIEIDENNKIIDNEPDALINYLEKAGNYINTKAPSVIRPEEVFDNPGKYLIIDIRNHADYIIGHIDGALNVKIENLIDFLKNEVAAFSWEKIILVCYSGQSASYATSMLRLLGFGNVFTMKWGMSGWNREFSADHWLKNYGNKFNNLIVNEESVKPQKNDGYKFPVIKTGKKAVYDILSARAKELLASGFKKASIKIDTLMKNPSAYYIINYWTAEEYKEGHLKDALQYTPKESYSKKSLLTSLPTDKPIVIYCFTGHTSAEVVAFLRILGYDAYSLSFGANSFMNARMASNSKIGRAYNPAVDINNFPTITGEAASKETNISNVKDQKSASSNSSSKTPVIKKKKTGSGGGC